MKLKEIKPGMVIHCNSQEEYERLNEETQRLGLKGLPTSFSKDIVYAIHEHVVLWNNAKNCNYTEFSDLIIPEMSAEEAFQIATEICDVTKCVDCPMDGCCFKNSGSDKRKVVEAISKWKSDHEKKEPEIETEWFWLGKILENIEGVGYCQTTNGTGLYDTECEYRESAEEYMADKLKEYRKTHDGEFIAVVEHVCIVKEVE